MINWKLQKAISGAMSYLELSSELEVDARDHSSSEGEIEVIRTRCDKLKEETHRICSKMADHHKERSRVFKNISQKLNFFKQDKMEWEHINFCPVCDEAMKKIGGLFCCEHCGCNQSGNDEEEKPTDSAGFNLKHKTK